MAKRLILPDGIRLFPRKRASNRKIPLQRYLQRRRTGLRFTGVLAGLLIGVLLWADRAGYFLYLGSDRGRYENGVFTVVRVIDGDTLEIAAPDGDKPTTKVRLWGIDTPELAKPWMGRKAQPWAEQAKELASRLSLHQQVRLMLESHQLRDKFGRLVAYVQLPTGSLLNEELLAAGLARAEDRFSHRWIERFDQIEQQARDQHLGIWADTRR